MGKSAIYITNISTQNVLDGGLINLGTIYRRFGQNLGLSGNAVQVNGSGYYDLKASITLSPTAAGIVTVTMLKDGVAVPGATASANAATEATPVNLSIVAMIREFCECAEGISNITFQLTGASEVSNIAVGVIKL